MAKEPTTHFSLRMDASKRRALENLAAALSIRGERGENWRRVTVSDILRDALADYSDSDECIERLLAKRQGAKS